MKLKSIQILVTALLLFALVTMPAVCLGEEISVDSIGVASWEAIPGAVQYEYIFVDAEYTSSGEVYYTTETSVQIPKGFSVHVRAVFENGETGDWMTSDYFGEPASLPASSDMSDATDTIEPDYSDLRVDYSYSTEWEDLKNYEVISNILYDTVRISGDDSVYFEAAAPDGSVMRFTGTGITVTEGAISFAPGSQLSALDAIGRICAVSPAITDPGSVGNQISISGGYTFTDAINVDAADELFFIWPFDIDVGLFSADNPDHVNLMNFQPNFISLGAYQYNTTPFTVSSLMVYYDEATFNTGIRLMALDLDQYASMLEGEYYDSSREVYILAERVYSFPMLFVPDVSDELEPFQPNPLTDMIVHKSLSCIDTSRYTIGALKDANGNVLDKNNAQLFVGSTIEVTIGDYTMDVLLPVMEQYKGAQTLHELAPFNNAFAEGEVTSLVIPVFWQDQPENATDEFLLDLCAQLGRVQDADGNVTDYSSGLTDRFSLSEYYDIASYDQYRITSFVTDWYAAPFNFIGDMENSSAQTDLLGQYIYPWLMETYPDMNWSQFDRDADGFFDSVIYVNAGAEEDDITGMGTYSYAIHQSMGYTGDGAGTQEQPKFKNFVSINMAFLGDNTLIHEFAHHFGLADYYDVSYSGIDAVGSYDMQSNSYGDWNAYSKYAVGWIEPEVVQGLSSGQSVEIIIGSFAETGDTIVVPAAGTEHDGPFGEYMLIDLFTDEGVNQYDANVFGLNGAVGVRIYHVNSPMEKRVITGNDGTEYPVGTIHFASVYNEDGKYLIELLQAGGDNTFTAAVPASLRTKLETSDLFQAGNVFTAERYSAFLKEGLMDDNSEFGYTIEIVSIDADANEGTTATIRITRQ